MRQTLTRIWDKWLAISRFIGDWIARVVLTLFYFTVLAPYALGVRLFSDPLAIRPAHRPQWMERTTHDVVLDDARRLS